MDDSPWQPPREGAAEPAPLPPSPEPLESPPADSVPASPWAYAASPAAAVEDSAGDKAEDLVDPALAATPERQRSKWVVIGAVAAVVAVVAAGLFAIKSFTGGASGGAESPEALGTQLLTAIDNEDVL